MNRKLDHFFNIYHDAIKTQHVFSQNNQVFLKLDRQHRFQGEIEKEEWSPIQFQWIPL